MKTEVLKLAGNINVDMPYIERAAKYIEHGDLVAFPTETVYGIACKAEKSAITKLDAIKERPKNKPYTLHIGSKDAVGQYVPKIPPIAEKLISKAWPGPLTVVFELSSDELNTQIDKLGAEAVSLLYTNNSIGIRCPADLVAAELLRKTSCPVVAPSANLAGREPATNVEEVMLQLDGKIDIALDAGPCEHRKASTVVKAEAENFQVLREGAYTKAQIDELLATQIVFVCTGNTCRSPIAEALAKKFIAEKLGCEVDGLAKFGYKVISAGLMQFVGMPASDGSVEFCAKRNVDLTSHRSRAVSAELLGSSDSIFVMTESHRREIADLWPEASQKCFLLDENGDIADPIGCEQQAYDKCGTAIEAAVRKRVSGFLK